MIFQIDKSFEKDLRKHRDSALNKKILKLLTHIQEIESLDKVPNLKK